MRPVRNDIPQVHITSRKGLPSLKNAETKLIEEQKNYVLDFLSGETFTIICPQSRVLQFERDVLPKFLSLNLDMEDMEKLCEDSGCLLIIPHSKHELEGLYKSVRRSGAEIEVVATEVRFSAIVNDQKNIEDYDLALAMALRRRYSENLNIYDRRSTVDDSFVTHYNHRYNKIIPEISDIKDKIQAQDLHNHYVGVVESLKLPGSIKIKCRERVAKGWIPSFILNWRFGKDLVKAAKALRVLEAKYGLSSPLNILDEKVQIPGVEDRNQFKKLLEENAKQNKKELIGGASLSFNGSVSLRFDDHPIDLEKFDLDQALNGNIVIRVTAKDGKKLIQVYTESKEGSSSFYEWFAKDYRDPLKLKLRIPQDAESVGEVESWFSDQKGEAVYLSGKEAVRYILKTCQNHS